MCPHDPTDSCDVTHGDGESPTWPPRPAPGATSAESEPASATRVAPDPIRENADTLGLADASTIDRPAAGLADQSAVSIPPTDPSSAAAMPTVPGYDMLAPLGKAGWGSSGRPGR
jgi:hypothetical protein